MRNPKARSFLAKLFGKKGGVIELPSFRRGWMHARAVRSALPGATEEEQKFFYRQDHVEDGKAFIRSSLIVDQPGLTKIVTRLAKSEAAKLPVGRITNETELKAALLEVASQLIIEKAKERQELEALIARYPGKPALVESTEALKEQLERAARKRANQVRLKGDQLDDAYNRAHGPYASIPSLNALSGAGISVPDLEAQVRAWHGALDPRYKPNLAIARVGELLIVNGSTEEQLVTGLSQKYDRPVLSIHCAAPFEKQAWSYRLTEKGQEIDRHTSDPFSLPVIYELLDEGEEVEFVRRVVRAECGDPRVLARCFSVDESQVRPYLIQIFSFELEKIWKDSKLFVELKAFPDDRYSLAGPWHFLDLVKRLGRAESSDGIWDHEVRIPAE